MATGAHHSRSHLATLATLSTGAHHSRSHLTTLAALTALTTGSHHSRSHLATLAALAALSTGAHHSRSHLAALAAGSHLSALTALATLTALAGAAGVLGLKRHGKRGAAEYESYNHKRDYEGSSFIAHWWSLPSVLVAVPVLPEVLRAESPEAESLQAAVSVLRR